MTKANETRTEAYPFAGLGQMIEDCLSKLCHLERSTDEKEHDREEMAREIAEQDAELEQTGRRYKETWAVYEEARGLLMDTIVYAPGSVAARDRVSLRELTAKERAEVLDQRTKAVQEAWLDFQNAEFDGILSDDDMPVGIRTP